MTAIATHNTLPARNEKLAILATTLRDHRSIEPYLRVYQRALKC